MPLPYVRDKSAPRELRQETPKQLYARARRSLAEAAARGNEDESWQMMFFVMYADPVKWKAVETYDPGAHIVPHLRPRLPCVFL